MIVIIRRPKLKEVVGLSPSTIDRMEKEGKFPKRRRYSVGVTGWDGREVEEWAKTAGKVMP